MIKITVPLTTLPTQNEQNGVVPITVTSSGSSRVYGEFVGFSHAIILVDVTAVSGSSPTLDLKLEGYNELADKWHTAATIPQITTTGLLEPVDVELKFIEYRLTWTVGGSSPSFTFTCHAIARTLV